MKNDILSWSDVKQKYLEFHKIDKFTENMAIDIDFGYWLVNNYIPPDVRNNQARSQVCKDNEYWKNCISWISKSKCTILCDYK